MAERKLNDNYFIEIARPIDLGLFRKAESTGIPQNSYSPCFMRKRIFFGANERETANAFFRSQHFRGMLPNISPLKYDKTECTCEDSRSIVTDLNEVFEEVKYAFNNFDEKISDKLWHWCQATDSRNQAEERCRRECPNVLSRPHVKIPFRALCKRHKDRMLLHECCPTCGKFCTEGVFNVCNNTGKNHLFHVGCQTFLGHCPHCGSKSYSRKWFATLDLPDASK